MSDSDSLASVDSSNPDLPWFCDVCRAGVTDPSCELCPNSGEPLLQLHFPQVLD